MKYNDESYVKFPDKELSNENVLLNNNDDDDFLSDLMLEQLEQMGAGF